MADQGAGIHDIVIAEDENTKTKRSSSIPLPKVFLASNVNNRKVYNVCNIVLYVLLFCAAFLAVILLILCIMSWSNRDEIEVTTTPIPERKFSNYLHRKKIFF